MKKIALSFVVVAIIAVALGTAGTAYAQSSAPQTTNIGTGYGYRMGGRGNGMGTQDGLLHDDMIAAYASKLGITVDELNTRLANGETMAEIATSKGLTFEEFTALRLEVRSLALDQAVKDGTLTQEQADWMKTRGAGIGNGMGFRGNGQGQFANSDCPYYQTNP
jgi:hypothetical protein